MTVEETGSLKTADDLGLFVADTLGLVVAPVALPGSGGTGECAVLIARSPESSWLLIQRRDGDLRLSGQPAGMDPVVSDEPPPCWSR